MEDGLAEFFARAPAAATAETHFAAQWKAYASDEPLTAALWLINNADPQAFPAAPDATRKTHTVYRIWCTGAR